MWNSLTVLYLALAAVATALVVGAALVGLGLAWKWPTGAPRGEARDDFDRAHHLAVTLGRVGTVGGILVAPLWFAALSSLVPAIEGGMCMASVHALGAPVSWVASTLKGVVPAVLLYWLVVDRADRRRQDERLLAHKLRVLGAAAVAALVSALTDATFLFTLELRPSACCMSLFDGPGIGTGPDGVSGWGWTVALGAGLAVEAVALVLARVRRVAELARVLVLAAAPLVMASVVLALHTELGSAIMGRSYHCLFCTWKNVPATFAATALVVVGAGWLAARALLGGALRRATGAPVEVDYRTPAALLFGGAGLLAVLAAAGG
ncbi:MAG: hypothetical protein IT373_08945 [Polyangiaceae bacterium]|nr:hypothetical protein [Polyangiaceae bacterium]